VRTWNEAPDSVMSDKEIANADGYIIKSYHKLFSGANMEDSCDVNVVLRLFQAEFC
jgi:hypothetical protein